MAIKDMLVIVDLAGKRPAVDVAALIAAQRTAHLTGLSLVFDPIITGYSVAPIPADFIVTARENAQAEANKAAEAFKAVAQRNGISFESRTADMLAGAGFASIVRQARLTDLVVIGQQDPEHPEPMREALIEALLFETGVPVMVVPYIGAPKLKLDKALVAWDGSARAARAVHAALPLLELTKGVEVMLVDSGAALADETGTDIAAYLARHGLDVTLRRVPRSEVAVADALLNHVADNAIDFVVMGAYGHSRLREMVFGGATRDVLGEMIVPVIMAH